MYAACQWLSEERIRGLQEGIQRTDKIEKRERSIHLPDVLKVDPSGDFFDEDRSQALGAELLVDAKEVDLNHLDDLVNDKTEKQTR